MSNPVPQEFVTQVWQTISGTSAAGATVLVNKMKKEQPALLAYLLAVSDALFDPDDGETFFYLGMVVWQIMKRWHKSLMPVSIESLDQAEEETIADLENVVDITEPSMWITTRFMLDTYPEIEVLGYIVEAINEPDADGIQFSDEGKGLAFIHLKTVLDALIRCRPQ